MRLVAAGLPRSGRMPLPFSAKRTDGISMTMVAGNASAEAEARGSAPVTAFSRAKESTWSLSVCRSAVERPVARRVVHEWRWSARWQDDP